MNYRWKAEILATRARKLARLAVHPTLWKRAAGGVFPGLEHTRTPFLAHYDWVYDAGASNGQFSSFALDRWPDAVFQCFEPIPECADSARAVVGDRGEVHEVALGARDVDDQLILSGRTDSSSLLPVDELADQVANAGEIGRIDIEVRRLEHYLHDVPRGQNLLKIDVQGLELDVLTGAGDLLGCFADVYVECSFRHLYLGQPLVTEVVAYMQAQGFRLVSLENPARNEERLILQADLLFRRCDETAAVAPSRTSGDASATPEAPVPAPRVGSATVSSPA